MSLQTRLQALVSAIGADVKALNNKTTSAFIGFGQMEPHATYSDFNAITDFGYHYVQGSTNGPNIPGGTVNQYYCASLSLGSEYPYAQYVYQIAYKRGVPGIFASRHREAGVWGSWAISSDHAHDTTTTTSIDGGASPSEAYNGITVSGSGGGGIDPAILDSKGDLVVASAADTPSRLGVGANGTVLTADSAEATGVKWAAPSGGGSARTELVVTSDQAIQGNPAATFVDITGLSWAAAANTSYEIEGIIWFTVAATTTGHRWGFVGPGLALANIVLEYQTSATAWATYDQQHANTTMAGTPPMAIVTASALAVVPNIVRVKGIIRNGATAGTLKMQGASELTNASVTVLKGSNLTYKAI